VFAGDSKPSAEAKDTKEGVKPEGADQKTEPTDVIVIKVQSDKH
jgi:hypothetical protein